MALTLAALQMALRRHDLTPGLVQLTDRGSQDTSADYRQGLSRAGRVCSSSRRGYCWENAVAESFLATPGCELLAQRLCVTRGLARAALFDDIKVFYNAVRRHSCRFRPGADSGPGGSPAAAGGRRRRRVYLAPRSPDPVQIADSDGSAGCSERSRRGWRATGSPKRAGRAAREDPRGAKMAHGLGPLRSGPFPGASPSASGGTTKHQARGRRRRLAGLAGLRRAC